MHLNIIGLITLIALIIVLIWAIMNIIPKKRKDPIEEAKEEIYKIMAQASIHLREAHKLTQNLKEGKTEIGERISLLQIYLNEITRHYKNLPRGYWKEHNYEKIKNEINQALLDLEKAPYNLSPEQSMDIYQTNKELDQDE